MPVDAVVQRSSTDLVVQRPAGLYCPPGDFYIDPWRPVARAVITHAHSDHASFGHAHYLSTAHSELVLRARLGDISVQTLPYGEAIDHHGVHLSLHPAGHVLGSAQVRLEHEGRVWVVSGDYYVGGASGDASRDNSTCAAFEPVRCDCFITESAFGLPIYRWRPQREVFDDINAWWRGNASEGRTSLLMGYAFGKAQHLLAGVDDSVGPIVVHGAVESMNRAYRAAGVPLPVTHRVDDIDRASLKLALVIAPPSAHGSAWARRFGDASDAFASGWMQLRGARAAGARVDRGFVLSDHADWLGLQRAIAATGAKRVIVTHGYQAVMVRWLSGQGFEASAFETEYGDEAMDNTPGAAQD